MSVSLLASSALARAPLAVLPLAGGDAPPQPVLSAGALLALAAAAIAILLVLVIKAKMSAFIAMLLVSMGLALATRIPVGDVVKTMTDGMGKTLGTVAMIVGLGAILGRVVEAAGGAEKAGRSAGGTRTVPTARESRHSPTTGQACAARSRTV